MFNQDPPIQREKQTELEVIFGEKQRLHPAAILFNLLYALKEMIFGLGIGFVLSLRESVFYFFAFALIFIVFLLVSSFLSWLRFTYYIKDGELRVEQGVFIRKKRYISLHRIHKIDVTANPLHRLFKLAKVQIDTASSSEGSEVMLSAIKVKDAITLRRALKVGSTSATETEEQYYPTYKISWRRLFVAGTTSGSVGFIFVASLAGFSQLEEFIPRRVFNATYQYMISLGIIILIVLGLLLLFVLWLIGIANTMMKYGNFTIEKRDNELFIKRGLLETKELTIPFDRIQAIGLEQSIIRHPFRYVTVYAVVAGGSFDKNEAFPVLFPLMKEHEVASFLQRFVPDYPIEDMQGKMTLPRAALKYYVFRNVWLMTILFFIALYLKPTYSWIPLVLMIVCGWYGWLTYQHGAVCLDGQQLTIRTRRLLSKITITTYKGRIQSVTTTQHPLQKKEKLQTIHLSLIGSDGLGTHYQLKHLTASDAERMAAWYSYEKPKTTCQTEENKIIYSTK